MLAMKRFVNFILAFILLIIFSLPMLLIAIAVMTTSKGPIFYWSTRIGKSNMPFKMPKFRTMLTETPVIASHLIKDPDNFITPIGYFLRRYSLDELPQLLSIIKGDMNFVGPRPALYNQYDLINLRKSKGIDIMIPGVTGWAQVNGRDKLSIKEKVKLELEYLDNQSIFNDILIIWKTIFKVFRGDGISH